MSTLFTGPLPYSLPLCINVPVKCRGIGEFRTLGGVGCCVNVALDRSRHFGERRIVQRSVFAQTLFEECDRIVRFPGFDLIWRSIGAIVIVGGVRVEAINLRFNQGWSFTV